MVDGDSRPPLCPDGKAKSAETGVPHVLLRLLKTADARFGENLDIHLPLYQSRLVRLRAR